MKQRIKLDFTEEELDFFLKENYGYGIWEFESSLVFIDTLHSVKEQEKVFHFIEKRKKQFEKLKRKITELLDDFSSEIDLYKLYNSLRPKKKIKWTPSERKKFIIKNFKLSSFYSVINRLTNSYQERTSRLKVDALEPLQFQIYLKPVNLVVLIWSNAMRKGNKVDWINMEILLNWFSKKLDEVGILNNFELKRGNAPAAESLRMIRNKYNNTKYEIFTKTAFQNLFTIEIAKDEGRKLFPKPLDELEEYVKWEYKDPDHSGQIIDAIELGL